MSLKLPQRPAFCMNHNASLLVSTYQLEDPSSRAGTLFFLSSTLEIKNSVKLPAGVFRFECPRSDLCISALTDGSLALTNLTDYTSNFVNVTSHMLLDVSFLDNKCCVSDNRGSIYMIDLETKSILNSVTGHRLPYVNEECEVWTCSLSSKVACSGGEDGVLRLWSSNDMSSIGIIKDFSAGVTFTKWVDDNLLLTGSYDQNIRIFDIRNPKLSVKTVETSGGVWHIEQEVDGDQRYLAACMYGGWELFDKEFQQIQAAPAAGEQLLYGVTFLSSHNMAYVTFNDFSVTLSSF